MKFPIFVLAGAIFLAGASVRAESGPGNFNANALAEEVRKPDLTISGNSSVAAGIIAFSPDGRYLAVASDKVVQVYDARAGDGVERVRTLSGHGAQILGLAFSDTNTLVSVSLDQTARVWDIETGKLRHTANLNFGKQIRFAIASGHPSLAVDSSFGKARLWNFQTGELLKSFEPNDSWVSELAFTPDGKLLVIGTDKGVVRVMEVATWTVTRTIDLDSPVRSLAASAEHILVGYSDGTVAMLNFGDQPSVPDVRKQNGVIEALAFSPKGERFASASEDHTVKVWNTATLKVVCTLEGHAAAVLAVAFSPSGQRLATMDADGVVNLWSVATQQR